MLAPVEVEIYIFCIFGEMNTYVYRNIDQDQCKWRQLVSGQVEILASVIIKIKWGKNLKFHTVCRVTSLCW